MFSIRKEFKVIHQNIPFCNSIMQCKHLLLRTFDFPKVVFYIFMSPINNAPLSNELQPVLIDLRHFKKVFGDNSLNFFSRFFYVPNGIVIGFVMVFMVLYLLTYEHHRIKLVRNSSKPCICDSLYHLFF